MSSLFSLDSFIKKDEIGECNLTVAFGGSYLYSFNRSYITDYHYDFCHTMVASEDWLRLGKESSNV
jgi:hypothetical protein